MLAVPLLLGINCGPLDEPKNGFVLLSGTAEGATATYSCRPGFVLEPEEENLRVCTHSGNWTGSVSKCRSTYYRPVVPIFGCACLSGNYEITIYCTYNKLKSGHASN